MSEDEKMLPPKRGRKATQKEKAVVSPVVDPVEEGDVILYEKLDYSKYYAYKQSERSDVKESLKQMIGLVEDIRELLSKSMGSNKWTIDSNIKCNAYLGKIEMLFLEHMGKYIEVDNIVNYIQKENSNLRSEMKEIKFPTDKEVKHIDAEKVLEKKLQKEELKRDLFSVVLESKGEEMDIKKLMREEMKSKRKQHKLDDIVLTRSKKLILRSEKKDDLEEIAKWIEENENIKEKINISQPMRRLERILLMGVHTETSQDMIKEDLILNINVLDPTINVVRPIKRRDELLNWVVDVDVETKRELLKEGRICIDLMRVRVVEFIRIIRCFKCQRFGHIASRCRHEVRCGKCGDSHEREKCSSEIESCVNCEESKDHCSDSYLCPSFVKYKKEQLSKRL